jgi:hypothetical protein
MTEANRTMKSSRSSLKMGTLRTNNKRSTVVSIIDSGYWLVVSGYFFFGFLQLYQDNLDMRLALVIDH